MVSEFEPGARCAIGNPKHVTAGRATMQDEMAGSTGEGSHGAPPPRALDEALALMKDLRLRCEWDREQTHTSLRPYLIEEAHEVDDAIASGDDATMRDELGDLLLQVLFHAVVAEERGAFTMQDVAGALVAKMRARHPHLYGDGVRRSWESMKAEKTRRTSLEEGLPRGLPSLHRAHRLQDRAAGVGFDWPDARGPLEKVREEVEEVAAHIDATGAITDSDALELEVGDLLFAVVNLARKSGVHPALALDRANAKFTTRYGAMERLAAERGLEFAKLDLEQQDALWNDVKRAAG
ncbi:MAG TPA: nucleoside triphosphate pyrophosphohydrolase [Gemmatimonas sp.]|nr:nucleoside triphosphate pyrophosphohydrolase [Gemmatimonas sp.]